MNGQGEAERSFQRWVLAHLKENRNFLKEYLEWMICYFHDAFGFFEEQRRHIGEAYRITGEIAALVIRGFDELMHNLSWASATEEKAVEKFKELSDLNVPRDILYQLEFSAGEKLTAFLAVKSFWLRIVRGEELAKFADPLELGIPLQAYLRGVAVALLKLSDMLEDYLLHETGKDHWDKLICDVRGLSEHIYSALDEFEIAGRRILEAGRRGDPQDSFRRKLGQVRGSMKSLGRLLINKEQETTVSQVAVAICFKAALGSLEKALTLLEEQDANIDKGHQLLRAVNKLTKRGIQKIKAGLASGLQEIEKDIFTKLLELKNLNLPGNMAWQLESSAGQEVFEFAGCKALWPHLTGNREFQGLPGPEELGLSFQEYLAGACDIPGELRKMLFDLEEYKKGDEEQYGFLEKFLGVATQIHKFLLNFFVVYPLVVNNTRRRGQDFQSAVMRAERAVRATVRDMLEIKKKRLAQ